MEKLLATDLDGTFIPWKQETDVLDALEKFRQLRGSSSTFRLVFVTGRDLQLVLKAIQQHRLPVPDTIIGDVGTSIFHRKSNIFDPEFRRACAQGHSCTTIQCWEADPGYAQELRALISTFPQDQLIEQVNQVPGVRLQEDSRQGEFKISFYIESSAIDSAEKQVQNLLDTQTGWSGIFSVDPETHEGLIDLLPYGVSKRYALEWYIKTHANDIQDMAFAGDSGNDYEMFISGLPSILVSNTPDEIKQRTVKQAESGGFSEKIFLASEPSTAGVWEGCHHFGVV